MDDPGRHPGRELGGHRHARGGLGRSRHVLEADQQHGLDDSYRDLPVARRVALHAGVVGARVGRGAEPEQDPDEEDSPHDEQDEHQVVNQNDHLRIEKNRVFEVALFFGSNKKLSLDRCSQGEA